MDRRCLKHLLELSDQLEEFIQVDRYTKPTKTVREFIDHLSKYDGDLLIGFTGDQEYSGITAILEVATDG